MRTITSVLLTLGIIISGSQISKAQTIELLAGNTLNGAINGTLLGGATMALNSDTDFAPLRIGVGLGTLYGLGMGTYDVVTGEGQQILVSGLFNDGNNTSIIVLLDTFYGAAAGAVIATSIMLIAEEPLVDGLRYGAATGAWIGFGVGVVDAFMFADRRVAPPTTSNFQPNKADGIVGIQFNKNIHTGLLAPSVIQTYKYSGSSLTSEVSPSLNFVNLKFSF